jgi:G:T-mismatch repair DNA endonuclease (very short patch repair protein)
VNKHGNKFEYSNIKYKNTRTKIEIICKMHGAFLQTPLSHLKTAEPCIKCSYMDRSNKLRQSQYEFITKAREKHGNIYDYNNVKYIRNSDKVSITCKIHGDFMQEAASHLRGIGCPICGNIKKGKSNTKTTEDFINKSIEVHGKLYDYGPSIYTGVFDKLYITCPKHGLFRQTAHDHLTGRGCLKCKTIFSKPCEKWLKSLNIPIEFEYKIPGTNLKADGFNKHTNTIYEFHGTFWHGHPSHPSFRENENHPSIKGKTWKQVFEHTLFREKCIRDLGYTLIIMWEHEFMTKKEDPQTLPETEESCTRNRIRTDCTLVVPV